MKDREIVERIKKKAVQLFKIRNSDADVIFSLETDSLKACVEAAVDQGISLLRANLAYTDLIGADLTYADLSGADLTNADLAEAKGIKSR